MLLTGVVTWCGIITSDVILMMEVNYSLGSVTEAQTIESFLSEHNIGLTILRSPISGEESSEECFEDTSVQ